MSDNFAHVEVINERLMALVKFSGKPYLTQHLLAGVSFKHLISPTCSSQEPTQLIGQQPLLPCKADLQKPINNN